MTFLKDLTIQVDPNATGVLKLPNLLDMMSKIVDVENHDGQIMDAFKWDSLLRYIHPVKRKSKMLETCKTLHLHICLQNCNFPSCFDKNGSGALTRSDMEQVLSVSVISYIKCISCHSTFCGLFLLRIRTFHCLQCSLPLPESWGAPL